MNLRRSAGSFACVASMAVAALAACNRPGASDHAAATRAPLQTADAPKRALAAADVDAMVRAAWRAADVAPARPVDDATYLRRVWLDLAGVVPPVDVTRAFLDDASPNKRAAAVAAVLASPRWAERWANTWDDILLGPDVRLNGVDREAFHAWVKRAFASNMPYDRFALELVTASGDSATNGAVNWLLRFRDAPADLTGTTSRAFLGVRIQCAECHDHKTEKWKQADFRALEASFLHTRARRSSADMMAKGAYEVDDVEGKVARRAPKKKLPKELLSASPRALDGTDLSRAENPRAALGAWIASAKNPWFARAFVNRVWGELVGRGFVEPVDDLRASNAPIVPELLDRLAADFAAPPPGSPGGAFDVKRLVTLITQTEVYAVAAAEPAKGAGQLWSRHPLEPLGSDALLDSIAAASRLDGALDPKGKGDLADVRRELHRHVSFTFDVDEPDVASSPGTVAQALMLLNGKLVNGATGARGGALFELVKSKTPTRAIVDELYLRALTRHPSKAELDHWAAFVAARRAVVEDPEEAPEAPAAAKKAKQKGKGIRDLQKGERDLDRLMKKAPKNENAKLQALEDVMWALLNSAEFGMKH